MILTVIFVLSSSANLFAESKQQAVPAEAASVASVQECKIRVRLTAKQRDISIFSNDSLAISDGKGERNLSAGAHSVKLSGAQPAKQRFHLFIKTFPPAQQNEARAFSDQWKSQGYDPRLIMFGKEFKAESGKTVEGRNIWVSIARLDSQPQAEALKAKLEKQQTWGWIVPETIAHGQGQLSISGAEKAQAPLTLRSAKPITIKNLDYGFWKPQRADRTYSGTIEIEVGPDGLLEIYETLPLEDYLAGVLPAEMPASWPVEALKAQAVSARSEILASLGGKHMLEGFDFCGTEHCRAYLGAGGREASTDKAVAETKGAALASAGRILPTVFCANCGGWTEDNECVWSGPLNPALRAIADYPEKKAPQSPGVSESAASKWITSNPQAYCSSSKDSFRWTRKFSASELRKIVNQKYPVGDIRSIELGDRGKGGRLKWVKVVGSQKTEIIRKELNIRLAFGSLKSAMFIVRSEGGKSAPASFTFLGGGRGHGVGLCQDGARGMAQAGVGYQSIIRHYFTNADLARMR
jgi:SpoIID/LytB domain protein